MSVPTTRAEFKLWCKRKLGWPVIEINLADEQIDDRVDEALSFYYDFHMDGTEKIYYKHPWTANNKWGAIYDVQVDSAGTLYSNADTLTFTSAYGSNASANIVTNGNGSIIDVHVTNNGGDYAVEPTITINTSTGTGGAVSPILGGFVQLPPGIIGAVNIFDVQSALNSSHDNLFNVKYQIALSELWTLTNVDLAPYYMSMHHLRVIEEVLIGKQPLRYNRNRNRLYVDFNWNNIEIGQFLIVEAYQISDPELYSNVWKDKWLQNYAACLIKLNWGEVLCKFPGMPMPGGLTFNGQEIKNSAQVEKDKLEDMLINTYSIPSAFWVG